MRKVSVYLSDEEDNGLSLASSASGRPQAELIREGIRMVIAEQNLRKRTFHSMGIGHGDGNQLRRWTAEEIYRRNVRS